MELTQPSNELNYGTFVFTVTNIVGLVHFGLGVLSRMGFGIWFHVLCDTSCGLFSLTTRDGLTSVATKLVKIRFKKNLVKITINP
jgi:hypothetical protein